MAAATIPAIDKSARGSAVGMRFGDRGTHTSRTIMLAELRDLLGAMPTLSSREDYSHAIVEENVLGKATAATRRLTSQRLGELYGLDRRLPIFRVLHRLWFIDEAGRPLLALLCALARDPLLRATAAPVINLAPGQELGRSLFVEQLREATGERLNDSVLDKVARNAASSWTQSGHLRGRVRKLRQIVKPTPGAVAFAFWLGVVQDLSGEELLTTLWAGVLDSSRHALLDVAMRAKQLGLLHVRVGGQVTEIDAASLDPFGEVR
jgi:hypothetical protein